MDKKKIIGIIFFVLIIIIGLFIKFNPFKAGKDGIKSSSVKYISLPEPLKITGASGYKLDKINLDGEMVPCIKIPLVTWGGYASLIAANDGLKPSKNSLFYKYGKFAVELIREEDPGVHLQGFANGDYPIIWSTMDMVPLLYEALKNDKRVIPQVFGVFDWSYGGDGIIVRGNIKNPKELKGKTIVTSSNSPSNFFLLWLLSQSDIKPSEVTIKYVADAVIAKDAFIKDGKNDACVTWSPFIYELTDPASKSYVEGSRLLITSKDANQLIADCYLARLDFIKEQPDFINNFSKAMMEGYDLFLSNKEAVYSHIASLFKLTDGAKEASLMLGDVHLANFPENLMFFDLENSISAYKIFFLSQEYYKNLGTISGSADYSAEAVINKKPLEFLKSKGLFANQTNIIKNSFNKQGSFDIADLESSRIVLTEDIQIHFDSQQISFDLNKSAEEILTNKKLLSKVAEQMNILGTTVVKLIGHLDTSKTEEFKAKGMQYYIEASAQAKLISKKRAEFVKDVLVKYYKCDPDRILTEGKGWDLPVDPVNQDKNRRVEVKFFSFE